MSLYDDDPTSSSFTAAAPAGLGSLADELAGAYSDTDSYTSEPCSGAASPRTITPLPPSAPASPSLAPAYSGEHYGDPDDLQPSGLSFSLEGKLAQLEHFALLALGEREAAAADNNPIPRLTAELQTLPPQSALETSASRLITAHAAVSSFLAHSTRSLRDLGYAISPGSLPAEDTAEMLEALAASIPTPSTEPAQEMAALHVLTEGLVAQLSFLSDSLYMVRQRSLEAGRRLRAAREACAEWKGELEVAERARRWIEDGDWDRRCRERRAEAVCKEVLAGFGEACGRVEEGIRGTVEVGGAT